jgi:hypothetical protein
MAFILTNNLWCQIWGSHSDSYEEHCLLVCDAVLTFSKLHSVLSQNAGIELLIIHNVCFFLRIVYSPFHDSSHFSCSCDVTVFKHADDAHSLAKCQHNVVSYMTNRIIVFFFFTLTISILFLMSLFCGSTDNICISPLQEAKFTFFISVLNPFKNIHQITNFWLLYFFIEEIQKNLFL